MGYSYIAGPQGQKWESFSFVSTMKNPLDLAMLFSKFELNAFETGGSEWAESWKDIAETIKNRCNANKSRVGYLRLSCHGNVGAFKMGRSVFTESNQAVWVPVVSQIAAYFVPGVSFVTIDSCKTGQGQQLLRAFSNALGGVDVRGYEEIQNHSTSEENGRGAFVTCRVNICSRNAGI